MSKRTKKTDDEAEADAQSQAQTVLSVYLLSEATGMSLDDAAAIYLRVMMALTNAMKTRAEAN